MIHDWKSAESFFIDSGHRSNVSLKTVSERFNIPYQSVRRYAAKHKWHTKRWMLIYPEEEQKKIREYAGL